MHFQLKLLEASRQCYFHVPTFVWDGLRETKFIVATPTSKVGTLWGATFSFQSV
jgi:hypothetical protein